MRLILCLFNDQGLGDRRAWTKLTPTAGPQVKEDKTAIKWGPYTAESCCYLFVSNSCKSEIYFISLLRL